MIANKRKKKSLPIYIKGVSYGYLLVWEDNVKCINLPATAPYKLENDSDKYRLYRVRDKFGGT